MEATQGRAADGAPEKQRAADRFWALDGHKAQADEPGAVLFAGFVRLLHEILLGVRTTAELSGHERLGTSGQLYHHLRRLVSAGWLRSTARGQYSVPPERVVSLCLPTAALRAVPVRCRPSGTPGWKSA